MNARSVSRIVERTIQVDKTQLAGDTYEKWLRSQTKRPGKVGGSGTPAPDSYETRVGKRVEMKLKASKTT
jgi:hypothetical protein